VKRLLIATALLAGCATTRTKVDDCASTEAFARSRTPVDAARAWLEQCGLDETVELTKSLVRHQTVAGEIHPKESPAFQEMADELSRFSFDNGFEFEVFGDHGAWEIRAGKGERKLGFVMHADIVPVREKGAIDPLPLDTIPSGWTVPPFDAQVKDGRLWGRGTEDDKAPIAAVLVAMKAMKRFGVEPNGQVIAIMGTGEEHDWSDMIAYAKTQPKPKHVISLDASYPLVIAESGFVAWRLRKARTELAAAAKATIVDARAGQFLTQVPGDASMLIAPGSDEDVEALRTRVAAVASGEVAKRGAPFSAEVVIDDGKVRVTTGGAAVHSSTSEDGHNALWLLGAIAHALDPAPSAVGDTLRLVAERFDGDHYGQKLGLAHSHDVMGPLAVIPTLLRVEDDAVNLSVNMRRPAGPSVEEFTAKLEAALARIKTEIDPGFEEIVDKRYVGKPALVDRTTAPIGELMAIYRRRTGDADAKPKSIRGGTYARLFEGAVSFGPSMPGKPYRGHAPDEYIELDVLEKMLLMVFDAAVELTGNPTP